MTSPILVTGSSGTVGRALVRQLLAAGHPVRALVRNEASAQHLPPGVELAFGDYTDSASLDKAMSGAGAVYALTPVAENATVWMIDLIEAARRAGVERLVKHSGLGARVDSASRLTRSHGESDEHLRRSGLHYTILQPNSYMQNMLWSAASIKEQGCFYQPLGDAKQAVIDVEDIAAVAVKALTEPGHDQQTYRLTGPESLDLAQQAALIGAATGRTVQYVAVPPAAAEQAMLEAGMPPWNVRTLIEFFGVVATGAYADVTPDVEKLLGRAPLRFAAFALRHATTFG